MPDRKVGLSLLVLSLALAIFVGAQFLSPPADVQADRVNPEDVCPSGGVKDDNAPWEATAAEGEVIFSTVVKAGNDTFIFTADGPQSSSAAGDCYTVTGLGTCHVTVTGGGTGKDCKAISHVVFCFGPGDNCEPSPTPTPTPEPTPGPH